MSTEFAGKGGKRPQIEISVDKIDLDPQNPRIVPYLVDQDQPNISQYDLIDILYENFDTEEVALSLVENGYFDEEPIIVVPNNLPADFSFADHKYEDLVDKLERLTQEGELSYTVVEGNRRLSTIKMLLDADLRKKLGSEKFYPKLEKEWIREDISKIPCIVYPSREEVSDYLGVRHITGLLKWEAFAKAAYIANTIDYQVAKGMTPVQAIQHVQRVVGDRTDTLRKQFVTYKMFEEAKHDLEEFDVRPLIDKFSLLRVMYNSPAIREYLNVQPYGKVDLEDRVVPSTKLSEFQETLTWIYGNNKTGEKPVLTDSRRITNQLSHVVKHPEAIETLRKQKDLDLAFERSNGEREYLSRNISKAFTVLKESLGFAYKYKGDKELLDQVEELEEIMGVLKKNIE